MDLIQYTVNALDSNYDGFVDALTHMLSTFAYDDACKKLPMDEQSVQFLKRHNRGSLSHLAFVSTTISLNENGSHNHLNSSNQGRGKNNKNNHGKHNRNNKRKNNSNKSTSQTTSSNKGVHT